MGSGRGGGGRSEWWSGEGGFWCTIGGGVDWLIIGGGDGSNPLLRLERRTVPCMKWDAKFGG